MRRADTESPRPRAGTAEPRLREITPACAGKRPARRYASYPAGNHPRMRGEEWAGWIVGVFVFGITPAYAGKSAAIVRPTRIPKESPPHARGRAPDFAWRISELGIAPACAGKRVMKMRPPRIWSYPLSANFPLFSKSHLQAPRDSRTRDRGLFNYQASQPTSCVPAGRGHQSAPEFLRQRLIVLKPSGGGRARLAHDFARHGLGHTRIGADADQRGPVVQIG